MSTKEYACTRCHVYLGRWANGLCDPCNEISKQEDAQELALLKQHLAAFQRGAMTIVSQLGILYREYDGRAAWYNCDPNDGTLLIITLKQPGDLYLRQYQIPVLGNVFTLLEKYVLEGTLPDLPEVNGLISFPTD